MIVAGWDKKDGGQVYGCPIGGTLVRESWTTDGSGSTFIWGHLDAEFRQVTLYERTPRSCTHVYIYPVLHNSNSAIVNLEPRYA